jgi:lysophospholipase L1-like esterase
MKFQRFFLILVFGFPGSLLAEAPDMPAPRTKAYSWMSLDKWREFHSGDLARAKEGHIDVLFLGDSITEAWEKNGAKVWESSFNPLHAANFGIGGDTTQNVLWRITEGGALEGVQPRVVVLMIGTNNFGLHGDEPEAVLRGIDAIVKVLQKERPGSKLLLLDIFPRGNPGDPMRTKVAEANRLLESWGKKHPEVTRLRIWEEFMNGDGSLPAEIMPDKLHLSEKGYAIWAEAMLPTLRRLLAES